MPFKPKVKAAFLAALRSGDYKIGRGVLKSPSYKDEDGAEFCCLGVLCDLGTGAWKMTRESEMAYYPADGSGPFDKLVGSSDKLRAAPPGDNGESAYFPPAAVRQKSGLTIAEVARLARLNDDGKSFAEIADIVEKDM